MELRGNLKDFSLPDIIQLVGFGRKTGVLRVDCGNGGAALFFDDGNVVHAEKSGMEGEAAVYSLFRIPEGEFRFQTETPPPGRTIYMDPTNLVMEAARLLDESRRDAEPHAAAPEEPPEELQELSGDWLGVGDEEPVDVLQKDTDEIKKEITILLKRRFGRGAKRLLQAVDECGNSIEELLVLAERVEKFVHVFIDTRISHSVGDKVREIITGSPSSV